MVEIALEAKQMSREMRRDSETGVREYAERARSIMSAYFGKEISPDYVRSITIRNTPWGRQKTWGECSWDSDVSVFVAPNGDEKWMRYVTKEVLPHELTHAMVFDAYYKPLGKKPKEKRIMTYDEALAELGALVIRREMSQTDITLSLQSTYNSLETGLKGQSLFASLPVRSYPSLPDKWRDAAIIHFLRETRGVAIFDSLARFSSTVISDRDNYDGKFFPAALGHHITWPLNKQFFSSEWKRFQDHIAFSAGMEYNEIPRAAAAWYGQDFLLAKFRTSDEQTRDETNNPEI